MNLFLKFLCAPCTLGLRPCPASVDGHVARGQAGVFLLTPLQGPPLLKDSSSEPCAWWLWGGC